VRTEPEELGVLDQPTPLAPQVPRDHALHLVEQELAGHAAEEAKGRFEA